MGPFRFLGADENLKATTGMGTKLLPKLMESYASETRG